MSSVFPSANESRKISDIQAIHTEVCAIETDILDSRFLGDRTVTISDTAMSTSTAHWTAFTTPLNECDLDQVNLLDLQKQVIDCFQSLKYSITRVTNIGTSNTFDWVIKW